MMLTRYVCIGSLKVALLAEGVDRNVFALNQVQALHVALLAEGVDRNIVHVKPFFAVFVSPSSRRAWIEISVDRRDCPLDTGRPPRGGRG